ncbi:uncharacterized protein LOC125027192 [Penaeus chinensis]|uniref:uncharacterized protein LOC125027192 n=1 Tax=Penaeus chinensis TaxID=139456 RepID=UPI001FB7369F|nr:uncharacterized protein LOC125027192 [Penaeus chinensis]
MDEPLIFSIFQGREAFMAEVEVVALCPRGDALHPPPQVRDQVTAAARVKMLSGPHASRIVRKYRRTRLQQVKRQEYKKLRNMVPALQEKNRVSKVEVIEATIQYIDELHLALIKRFRSRGLPATLRDLPVEAHDVHGGNIRELVRHLLATCNPTSLPPTRIENARTLPSFIQKLCKRRS